MKGLKPGSYSRCCLVATSSIIAAPFAASALAAEPSLFTATAGLPQPIAAGPTQDTSASSSPPNSDTTQISEIVVTATRRAESIDKVPFAITALDSKSLDQNHVSVAEDYFKLVPNLTFSSVGPGQNQIYMRGLSTVTTTNNVSGGVGSFPNVAVYLDDQPVQLPGRNLDIYAADMERIEALEGPQGTLFGAGAQAGVIRYITNKPDLNTFKALFQVDYALTRHGSNSENVQGFVNIPLIPDQLALRVVGYSDHRGGYIDNVPGTYQMPANAPGLVAYNEQPQTAACPNCTGLPSRPTINNTPFVGNDFNPTTYTGERVSLKAKISDDWDILLSEAHQELSADGVFGYDPSLGDLKVMEFNPNTLDDKFTSVSWSVDGHLGALKAIYTGAYLDRSVNQVSDYTRYAQTGFTIVTYECNAGAASPQNPAYGNVNPAFGLYGATQCYTPSSLTRDIQTNTHWSHELRFSSPDDWRLRFIGGLFYESFKIQDSANFVYSGSTDAGFFSQAPASGSTAFDPSMRPAGTTFFDDVTRGYKQKAAFADVSFDLIPHQLTVSGGVRAYSMDTFELGSANSDYYCRTIVACASGGKNLDAQNLQHDFNGVKGRANMTWRPNDTTLVYATWSQGFRPGGFNRGAGVVTAPFRGIFDIPLFYNTDDLTNIEVGFKVGLLDRRVQFNVAAYQEDWSHVQLTVFNPAVSNFTFSANGPNYRVRGTEIQVTAIPLPNLRVTASAAYNDSTQLTELIIRDKNNNPISVFPTAGIGSPLAQAPKVQGSAQVRYEHDLGEGRAYVQGTTTFKTQSYSSVLLNQRESLAGYTMLDAAAGIMRQSWRAEVYADNLSDKRANLYNDKSLAYPLVITGRPRTLGLRVTYSF